MLGRNVSTALTLVKRKAQRIYLTRRERRLLSKTTGDMFRLIPFIIIVAVPFMEFALPFLLKFFPNLLPSTYVWKSKLMEDRFKKVKARLEMAKFLQQSTTDAIKKNSTHITADEFLAFMDKVQKDQKVSNADILKFSQLFEDEFTLNKLSRVQLIAMDNYLRGSCSTPVFFTADTMRTRLRSKIEKIKEDDKLIEHEGIDSLTHEELVEACIERGMKTDGVEEKQMQHELEQWLALSLHHNIPHSLLILSRAFMITQNITPEEAIEDTLAHIPPETVQEVVTELTEHSEEKPKEEGATAAPQELQVSEAPKEEKVVSNEEQNLEDVKKMENLKKDESQPAPPKVEGDLLEPTLLKPELKTEDKREERDMKMEKDVRVDRERKDQDIIEKESEEILAREIPVPKPKAKKDKKEKEKEKETDGKKVGQLM